MSAAKRPFVRFYHQDWCSDNDIDNMSMQEVGVYWTLLVRQMVEGFVHTDLTRYQKRLGAGSVAEVEALVTPLVRSKFQVDPADPSKMRNGKLLKVIDDMDRESKKNRENIERRYGAILPPSLESALAGSSETAAFDFAPILKDYPPRPNRAGVSEGLEKMRDTITDPETYQRLWAAVRAYRDERARIPRAEWQYTKQLNTFMIKHWSDYVPAKFKPSKDFKVPLEGGGSTTAAAVEATPEASPAPVEVVAAVPVPAGKRSEREVPPWTHGPYDAWDAKQRREKAWPQERREAWERGEI